MAKCPCCGQELESEPTKKQGKQTAAWIDFVEKWNKFATKNGLPCVREDNTSLASKFFTRLKAKEFWEDLRDATRYIQNNAFFRGTNDRQWKASAEYLLGPGKLQELAAKQRAEHHVVTPPIGSGECGSAGNPVEYGSVGRSRGEGAGSSPQGMARLPY